MRLSADSRSDRPLENTICVLLTHVGRPSTSTSDTCRTSPDSTFRTYKRPLAGGAASSVEQESGSPGIQVGHVARSEINASSRPSGDQLGHRSNAPCRVTLRKDEPSSAITKISTSYSV